MLDQELQCLPGFLLQIFQVGGSGGVFLLLSSPFEHLLRKTVGFQLCSELSLQLSGLVTKLVLQGRGLKGSFGVGAT